MPYLVFSIVRVLLPTALLASAGMDQRAFASELSVSPSILEMLREELLDTVKLEREVHLTTPQATDVVVPAGTYRIGAGEPSQMRIFALKNKTAIVVDALSIYHQTDIEEPVALYVRDDEKFPHIVLLLPAGKGLEAVGSYDGIRSRDLRSRELTESQIERALKEKIQKNAPH